MTVFCWPLVDIADEFVQPEPTYERRIKHLTGGKIRTGVIGLGYFGSFHARQHAANQRAALVAVVDADRERAESLAAEYGVAAFSDHHELIGKVDAVSVTVPTSLHHQVAADLLDAGIHVLIEKPIADTPEAARDLIARAQLRRAVLQIGHIERFSPVFAALRDAVKEPLTVECTRIGPWKGRAIDVDVVLDLMIHDIDLVLTLIGSPVVAVSAVGAGVLAPTNDFAHAQLRFENGAMANLHASRIADRAERTIRVVEPERHWTADLSARTLASFDRGAGLESRREIVFPASDNLASEIDSFLAAIAAGTGPVVDGQAGLDALLVAGAIIDSIESRSPTASPIPSPWRPAPAMGATAIGA